MKTKTAIKLAGSSKHLAGILGITQGAISQWGDQLPAQRIWQLKVIKPEWFSKSSKAVKSLQGAI